MYRVPDFVPKVYLIHISGERWEFKDLKEAANELYRLRYYDRWRDRDSIGENFNKYWVWTFDESYRGFYQYEYIVRDELGDVITVDDLDDERDRPIYRRWWHYPDYDPDKNFRKDPVAHTGRHGGGHWYRRPKTTQERRATYAHETDEDLKYYGVKIRAKRNSNNLVDSWDDLPRRSYQNKNWKHYRKTQYRRKR